MLRAGTVDFRRVFRNRVHAVLLLGGLGAALTLLRAFDLSGTSLIAPCLFHTLTGFHCPGCGSLRALHQILNGNVGAALALNPLAVAMVPVIAYDFVARALCLFNGCRLPSLLERRYSARVLLVAVVAFWILRNIPHYPFTLLAP